MSINRAPEIYDIPVGATRTVKVSFLDELAINDTRDVVESITGSPTFAEGRWINDLFSTTANSTADQLTVGTLTPNTEKTLINNRVHPTGSAVQFTLGGVTAGTTYAGKVTCSTSVQTLVGYITARGVNG